MEIKKAIVVRVYYKETGKRGGDTDSAAVMAVDWAEAIKKFEAAYPNATISELHKIQDALL